MTRFFFIGDGVMADKGFRIESNLQQLGLHLNIPPFCLIFMSNENI